MVSSEVLAHFEERALPFFRRALGAGYVGGSSWQDDTSATCVILPKGQSPSGLPQGCSALRFSHLENDKRLKNKRQGIG